MESLEAQEPDGNAETIQTVRVQADRGLSINCTPNSTDVWLTQADDDYSELGAARFGPHCDIDVSTGETANVHFKAQSIPTNIEDAYETKQIYVITEKGQSTVSAQIFKLEESNEGSFSVGRYEGFYWKTGVQLRARTEEDLQYFGEELQAKERYPFVLNIFNSKTQVRSINLALQIPVVF